MGKSMHSLSEGSPELLQVLGQTATPCHAQRTGGSVNHLAWDRCWSSTILVGSLHHHPACRALAIFPLLFISFDPLASADMENAAR